MDLHLHRTSAFRKYPRGPVSSTSGVWALGETTLVKSGLSYANRDMG
jgi:hypothetical protein